MNERYLEKEEELYHQMLDKRVREISNRVPVPGSHAPEQCHCGENIPLVRREAGYKECVSCAKMRDLGYEGYTTIEPGRR